MEELTAEEINVKRIKDVIQLAQNKGLIEYPEAGEICHTLTALLSTLRAREKELAKVEEKRAAWQSMWAELRAEYREQNASLRASQERVRELEAALEQAVELAGLGLSTDRCGRAVVKSDLAEYDVEIVPDLVRLLGEEKYR